jgi:hypothetical protein
MNDPNYVLLFAAVFSLVFPIAFVEYAERHPNPKGDMEKLKRAAAKFFKRSSQ